MRHLITLCETLNSAIPVTWRDVSSEDVTQYQAEFQIKDGFFKMWFKKPYYDRDWRVEFTRNDTHSLTGSGDAFLVMSTVMTALEEFIISVRPRFIIFQTNDAEPSRSAVYQRLLRKMIARHPYAIIRDKTVGHINRSGVFRAITLSRTDNLPEIVAKDPPVEEPNRVWTDEDQALLDELGKHF